MSDFLGFDGNIGVFEIGPLTQDEVAFVQRIAHKQRYEHGGDDFKAVFYGDSREDVLGDSPELTRISAAMESAIAEYIMNIYPDALHSNLDIDLQRVGSWLNVTKDGKPIHAHAADIVALIYLCDIDDSGDGRTVFMEPVNARMGMKPGLLQGPLRRSLRMTPQEGRIVVFPGYLEHAVEPYSGQGSRITLGADFCALDSK